MIEVTCVITTIEEGIVFDEGTDNIDFSIGLSISAKFLPSPSPAPVACGAVGLLGLALPKDRK